VAVIEVEARGRQLARHAQMLREREEREMILELQRQVAALQAGQPMTMLALPAPAARELPAWAQDAEPVSEPDAPADPPAE
jgi:hypothetical protein